MSYKVVNERTFGAYLFELPRRHHLMFEDLGLAKTSFANITKLTQLLEISRLGGSAARKAETELDRICSVICGLVDHAGLNNTEIVVSTVKGAAHAHPGATSALIREYFADYCQYVKFFVPAAVAPTAPDAIRERKISEILNGPIRQRTLAWLQSMEAAKSELPKETRLPTPTLDMLAGMSQKKLKEYAKQASINISGMQLGDAREKIAVELGLLSADMVEETTNAE